MLFGADPVYTYIQVSGEAPVFAPAGAQTVVVPVLTTSSSIFNTSVIPQSVSVVCQVIDAPSVLFNPTVVQIVQSLVLSTSSTIFEPTVIPGSVSVVTPVITVSSSVLNPLVEYIVQTSVLNTSSTIFDPSIVPGSVSVVLPVLTTSSTVFDPGVLNQGSVLTPLLETNSTIFNPSVVNLLQIINVQLLQVISTILNPSVSGGSIGGSAVGSIMDRARVNMLAELILTEPQQLTNSDLMRLVILDPGQTTITITEASAANQLWRYLATVRDS